MSGDVAGTRNAQARVLLALGLGLAVGLVLRLLHLDEQTLTHPEFYVPALNIPDYLTTPSARFTSADVLREALLHDKHPPGYHLLMLAWNLNVGTEVFRIRLSSVLFGVLGLAVVPWYVRVNRSAGMGILAVWLLALHGFHIFWSQQARPWVLIGTLGLVTTALLVSLVRRPRLVLMLAYGLIAGFGLWVDYYFWPIVCAQAFWAVLHELDRVRAPLALAALALAAIAAAPMVLYFYMHLTQQESHIRLAGWQDLLRFVRFGGVVLGERIRTQWPGAALPFELVATALGVTTIAFGLPRWNARQPDPPAGPNGRPRVLFAILAAAAIATSAWTWSAFFGIVGDRKIFRLALAAPFVVLSGWLLIHLAWRPVARALVGLSPIRWLRGILGDAVTAIPLVAFGAVMLAARVKPVLAEYAMVSFTPFVVVIAARGIDRMGRLRIPVAAAVIAVFAVSVLTFGKAKFSSIEYKALGLQLAERVTPGQVIVLRDGWDTAPLNYYLPPDRFRVIPIDHRPETEPPLRVALPDSLWLVAVGDDDAMIDERLADAERFVPGYTAVERISTGSSGARLMVRPPR